MHCCTKTDKQSDGGCDSVRRSDVVLLPSCLVFPNKLILIYKFCKRRAAVSFFESRHCPETSRPDCVIAQGNPTEDMHPRAGPRACTCWFLILLSYLLQRAWGLVDTEIVPTNAKYLMRWKQFEMGIGGTAKVSIDYNPNVRLPLRVYVCSPEEIKVLLDVYQR